MVRRGGSGAFWRRAAPYVFCESMCIPPRLMNSLRTDHHHFANVDSLNPESWFVLVRCIRAQENEAFSCMHPRATEHLGLTRMCTHHFMYTGSMVAHVYIVLFHGLFPSQYVHTKMYVRAMYARVHCDCMTRLFTFLLTHSAPLSCACMCVCVCVCVYDVWVCVCVCLWYVCVYVFVMCVCVYVCVCVCVCVHAYANTNRYSLAYICMCMDTKVLLKPRDSWCCIFVQTAHVRIRIDGLKTCILLKKITIAPHAHDVVRTWLSGYGHQQHTW